MTTTALTASPTDPSPYDVMMDLLRRERPAYETATVDLPVWAALIAIKALRSAAFAAGDNGAPTQFQGELKAALCLLNDGAQRTLDLAGLPGEPGVVHGEPTTVRLWPAATDWQPIRETVGEARPVRLAGVHRCRVVTAQRGQAPRFIVDGVTVTAEQFAAQRGLSLAPVIPEVQARAERSGGATFIEALNLRANGEWRVGSTYLGYAVVPATPEST
ncbi:hypothetical protein [Deinococcus soli (ex Cha et al. 2016)]|uniref:Uncharacterized protein n=2 Tax=Deinococcus soli (ex Cha et al. 2016) TaxID=1309411 RepID=A0AAE4BL68_9DEIO|nr:hypothetical protein [Deinococcus soli (ex Cha et al. 2016)]MDR6218613.1 hypothetical protein [Deinococcus soli (ex Cha et al. 2016)]MDR6328410.1 hypothetical protein [Deinococcus soli (ex Cha et al. 2016)]MDR6753021.1 hypothetical protein [Deinococcus soli (ex Cha et al. 2016)]